MQRQFLLVLSCLLSPGCEKSLPTHLEPQHVSIVDRSDLPGDAVAVIESVRNKYGAELVCLSSTGEHLWTGLLLVNSEIVGALYLPLRPSARIMAVGVQRNVPTDSGLKAVEIGYGIQIPVSSERHDKHGKVVKSSGVRTVGLEFRVATTEDERSLLMFGIRLKESTGPEWLETHLFSVGRRIIEVQKPTVRQIGRKSDK